MGVAAGLLVFAFEQRRSRDIRAKIAVIAAMNHHVRNALQTISYAPYTEQAKQIQLIEDGIPNPVGVAGDSAWHNRVGQATRDGNS